MSKQILDNITLERIKELHPKLRDEATRILEETSEVLTGRARLRFAYTLRTIQEQNDLYAQGRTKLFDAKGNRLGIVTNARGGESYHNYGLAVDIVLITPEGASWDIVKDFDNDGKADWMEVSEVFEKYGWNFLVDKKGKRWDFPHFQKTFGLSIAQLQKLVKDGKVDKEGYVTI